MPSPEGAWDAGTVCSTGSRHALAPTVDSDKIYLVMRFNSSTVSCKGESSLQDGAWLMTG